MREQAWWRRAVDACFYGHLFYGVCAVAQVLETSVQLVLPFNVWLCAVAFISTVLFYNYPYARGSAPSADPRVVWHRRHRQLVQRLQRWGVLALLALVLWLVIRHAPEIRETSAIEWLALFAFPAAGAFYYRTPVLSQVISLRRTGWLKPFVIGFVWAGMVVAYPVLLAPLQHGRQPPLSLFPPLGLFPWLLFIKAIMFIAVLAILFDIKDHEADQRAGLTTIVALFGIERTLFQVSLPLTMLGIATFLSYATVEHLSAARVVLVLIPLALLIAAIVSLKRPRGILYYLTVIDGLMLAKALFDIWAMRY